MAFWGDRCIVYNNNNNDDDDDDDNNNNSNTNSFVLHEWVRRYVDAVCHL